MARCRRSCTSPSAASPPAYLDRPIATLEVGSIGTQHALELARKHDGARVLLASTSEIYGDPEQSPQRESYWGNVNPVGPRSVYDEAKRFGEAITMAYHRALRHRHEDRAHLQHVRPVPATRRRPRHLELPRPGDRRPPAHRVRRRFPHAVVLLRRRPRRSGSSPCSTRPHVGPMNLGNPNELTVLELARRRARRDRFELGDRLRAVARRRSSAATSRHRPRRAGARLASGGRSPRRSRPHVRLVPGER